MNFITTTIAKTVVKAKKVVKTILEKTKELMMKFLTTKAGHAMIGAVAKSGDKAVELKDSPKAQLIWSGIRISFPFVAALGAGMILSPYLALPVVVNKSIGGRLLTRLAMRAAAFVIAGKAGEIVSDWADDILDYIAGEYLKFVEIVTAG